MARDALEPRLVVFFIALPDSLPLPDGAIHTFTHAGTHVPALEGHHVAQHVGGEMVEWRGELFSSLRFWQGPLDEPFLNERRLDVPFQVIERILPQLLPKGGGKDVNAEKRTQLLRESGAYVTVVEAVTPLLPLEAKPEDALTEAFERCFELIDEMVGAYRLYARELFPRLTRERLPPIIPYATRALGGKPQWDGLSLFLLHVNVGETGADPLDQDEVERFNLYLETVSRGHPFALFGERSLDALVAFEREGRFADAVVHAQTSVEVLLDSLLALMLWEEGKAPQEAANGEFEDRGFEKRVRTHFHGRLGGDWKTKGGGVMSAWAEHVARMRNRVVHAGYRPSREDARRAVRVASEVEEFIRNRITAARDRYPRTTLLVLGQPGLERAGVWKGSIREFAERADEEPDWIASFRLWRDELDQNRLL